MTKEDVLELARPLILKDGLGWDEPVDARPFRDGRSGMVLWRVLTNAASRGGHVAVTIEDATGEVIDLKILPM